MALDHVPPNARLARELVQVANEAVRVADTARGVNMMPRTFPSEAIGQICISLANLKHGTAEGCHEPLNFARYMLPLVRRDHFHIEGEEPELEDDEDTYFSREHPLDLAITRLYVAVGTALDEYRAQAQDKYDDHVGAEETLEFSEDGTFADIDHRSREVAQNAEAERQNLSELGVPGSTTADRLSRQIQDGANIAHSIQSQLRIRPVVARWYKSANAALRKLPDLMISTADAMRVGTDVGQIWLEQWSALKKRIRHLAYDSMYSLADALEATGERLKKPRRSKQPSVERQRDPETVAAENRVIEILISGEALPSDLARKVEVLRFPKRGRKIMNEQDLTRLENLKGLFLGKNNSYSYALPVISQLTNLTSLSMRAISVSDLSALGQLTNLISLTMLADNASDLSALGQLTNLTSLSLQANNASDISVLGQLSNLTKLSVRAKNASDLSALGQLTNLTSLTVHANNASDLSALGQLSNLISLSMQADNVSDISVLGQLTNLTSLSVQAKNASDISVLGQLSNLTRLTVQASNASDLSALGQLTNLTSLTVHANNASDLSALGQLSNLTSLSMHANNASDLSALGQLSNLTRLTVQASNFDLRIIQDLNLLVEMNVASARDLDLAPIAKMNNLKKLKLSNVRFRNMDLLDLVEVELVGDSRELN